MLRAPWHVALMRHISHPLSIQENVEITTNARSESRFPAHVFERCITRADSATTIAPAASAATATIDAAARLRS